MNAIFTPVGTARQENGRYFVQLDEKMIDATLELETFSHILVVWWFHEINPAGTELPLVMNSPYRGGPETIGVFATRGPVRPNPIAITVCGLLGVDRQKGRLEVNYLDAAEGTPILDIKPYHPSSDTIRSVTMPAWCAHWPKCYEDSGTFDWSQAFNFES